MFIPFNDRMETLYIIIGCLNLAIAFFINLGVLFSSISFAFLAAVLIGLPLFIGLVGITIYPRVSSACMMFGCAVIIIYILVAGYFSLKAGYSPILFHRVWLVLNVVQATLAILRVKQFNHRGVLAQ